MLSTAIGVQFNVNDLDATYEIIGTSDNYSFQYNLGRGSDLVDFEGESVNKAISLEGNYGVFDVRVFAASDIGVRSEFIESGISISPPQFDDTFTFANITVDNLPDNSNYGFVNTYDPVTPGDKLEVESEYIGKNLRVSWGLIPPQGHAQEGQVLGNELLNDSFFDKFEIVIENGEQAQVISDATLDSSAGLQDSLLTASVSDTLGQYREFSITLNEQTFEDLNLERVLGLKIIAHDSFGRTSTGILTGVNYEPDVEGLSYAFRGSDMSFSWFSNDTDFSGVNVDYLAIPSTEPIKYTNSLSNSINYYKELNEAQSWNFGRGEYRSGDMVLYADLVYQAKQNITLSLIESTGRQSSSPLNSDLWENLGPKISCHSGTQQVFEETFETTQVWGYSYYYAFQAFDAYGEGKELNLTNNGLIQDGELFGFSSEVKIGSLRYRERKDDLIFNWEIVDQDGTLVDLEQYRFALTNADVPSILGVSGSIFDADTKRYITGITEGNTSKISSVDEFGNRTVVYDLPNTKVFDTYEFTREINNEIYGTGGFPVDVPNFDSSLTYSSGDIVYYNDKLYTCLQQTQENIQPVYDNWDASHTYAQGDIIEYIGSLYKTNQDFGPDSDSVIGFFETGVSYNSGDFIIFSDSNINPYFTNVDYLAGDVVFYNQTLYLSLRNQSSGDNFIPDQSRDYWKVLSMFDDVSCLIYKAKKNIFVSSGSPYADYSGWEPQNPDSFEGFEEIISGYSLPIEGWYSGRNYLSGSLVLYNNDIWSGVVDSGPSYENETVPGFNLNIWSNIDGEGGNIFAPASEGDLVYAEGSVFRALINNPSGAPIQAIVDSGNAINSDYESCGWIPFWEENTNYNQFVYGHKGIPQSGKRSIGIEVGIIDNTGQVLHSERLIGINQEPSILPQGFQVDSLSETTKVKFNFNYAFATQEKTTKVHLYRSTQPDFNITNSNGLPYDYIGEDSSLVKVTLGAADATFGENITEIVDSPPIPNVDGIDQITGYYYKILPFDDFGSGDTYNVIDNQGTLDRVLVYPKNYSSKNINDVPGPVFRTSSDDVPGPVLNFSGSTAFENYFLNWSHPSGNISAQESFPNDLSHYEVWISEDDKLELGSLGSDIYLKSQADQNISVDFSNDAGYRRIEGEISSSGPIPIELQDPASGITNAIKAFDVSVNGSASSVSYFGLTNETRYFWIRAVDFAGNKSPFTGAANLTSSEIQGLGLTLGQASATDIDDFELNMTETFGNSIALAPNSNPFFDEDGSYVSWPDHVLYYQGTGYLIDGSGIGPNYEINQGSYIWWDNNQNYTPANPAEMFQQYGLKNIYYKNINYFVSDNNPAGGNNIQGEYIEPDQNFNDGDFIVARIIGFPSQAKVKPVYYSFANALIGTANIAEAAIIDAKIKDLKADKITAGEIRGEEIILGTKGGQASPDQQYGSIATAGFSGYQGYNVSPKGFALSGDGTFEFRAENGNLKFDQDGTLSLEGRLRQSDGTPYDFIDLNASPSFFNYVETNQGYDLQDFDPIKIVASFRNSNVVASDVLFRMDSVVNDNNASSRFKEVFSYEDWENSYNNGVYSRRGLSYDINPVSEQFEISGSIRHATAFFDPGDGLDDGFDDIITEGGASSVMIYCSGRNGNYESSINVGRIIDGKQGDIGPRGVSSIYQGDWTSSQTYYFEESFRADIVKYEAISHPTHGPYFIANTTHAGQQPIIMINGQPQLNDSYWSSFAATFTSVATQLLVTENSVVTDTIEIGQPNILGRMHSNGFIGGGMINNGIFAGVPIGKYDYFSDHSFYEEYQDGGFNIGRDSFGNAFFDIGGPIKDPLGQEIKDSNNRSLYSYMRFNSEKGKIEIKGAFTNNSSAEDIGPQISAVLAGASFANLAVNDSLATFVAGGYDNTIYPPSENPNAQLNYLSLASSILGGGLNEVAGRFSTIANGFDNLCYDNFSFIGGGYQNKMDNLTELNEGANFIGAGQNNRIFGGTNQSIIGGSNNIIYQ